MVALPGPLNNSKQKSFKYESTWTWPGAAGDGPTFTLPDLQSVLTIKGTVLAYGLTGGTAPDDIRVCEFGNFIISVKRASDGSIVGVDDSALPIAIPNTKNDGTFIPTMSLVTNGAGVSLAMAGMTLNRTIYDLDVSYGKTT